MFGDSSQDVFGAVAFLRGKVNTGNSCSAEKTLCSAKHELHQ